MTDLLRDLDEFATAESSFERGSAAIKIAAHHAEIAEAAADAKLWRYLVAENNKGVRGKFRICWLDAAREGFITTDGVSCNGKDEQAIIRIVSDAMSNSEREDESHD